MNQDKKYIQVSLTGFNVPKGHRKPKRFMFEIAKLDSMEQRNLESLFETAKTELARLSKVSSCNMVFNHAKEDSEMKFVSLFPIETLKVL